MLPNSSCCGVDVLVIKNSQTHSKSTKKRERWHLPLQLGAPLQVQAVPPDKSRIDSILPGFLSKDFLLHRLLVQSQQLFTSGVSRFILCLLVFPLVNEPIERDGRAHEPKKISLIIMRPFHKNNNMMRALPWLSPSLGGKALRNYKINKSFIFQQQHSILVGYRYPYQA